MTQWWQELSAAQKAIRAGVGIVTALVPTVVFLTGWLTLPSKVEANEARIERLEATVEPMAPRAEYLFCVDLADRDLITKTPQDCYEDYTYQGEQ